jgi:glycosyltransferase involved in cell wall biosynthesis
MNRTALPKPPFNPLRMGHPSKLRGRLGHARAGESPDAGTVGLRIAFHAPRAHHLQPGSFGEGGDKVFIRSLVASLRDRGHQVEFVSQVDARDLSRGRTSVLRLVIEAMRVYRRMRQFSPDAWLVHLPSVNAPDFFGWWQRPNRYVLMGPGGGGRAKDLETPWRHLYKFTHRKSLARAHNIVAFHPRSAKRLRSAGISDDRLSLIPAPATTWDRIPTRAEARRRLELPANARIILCVSRFSVPRPDRRGSAKTEMIVDLLAAIAPLPSSVMLVVVGDGPGRPQIEREVAEQNLADRVRLFGAVENEDVVWFYAACDFYAYPHTTDRCWLSVLEAQACGRPVVTMRTSAARITVADGHTGLLAADPNEFRRHLETLARNQRRCEVMGEAARVYVQQNHSLQLRVEQIENLMSVPA